MDTLANSHLGLKLIPKAYHQEPDDHEAEVHGHIHTQYARVVIKNVAI